MPPIDLEEIEDCAAFDEREGFEVTATRLRQCAAELRHLRAVEQAAEELGKFTRHSIYCEVIKYGHGPCTCGSDTALSAFRAAQQEGEDA